LIIKALSITLNYNIPTDANEMITYYAP